MSQWKVTSDGPVVKYGSYITVEDGSVAFTSVVESNLAKTIKEPDASAQASGLFTIFRSSNNPYNAHSTVAGDDMNGCFRYLAPVLEQAEIVDPFTAIRSGSPVPLSLWKVKSDNKVIADRSMIEIWSDFVTFVSAVENRTLTLAGVSASAEGAFTFGPAACHPEYEGHAEVDPITGIMRGTFYYARALVGRFTAER